MSIARDIVHIHLASGAVVEGGEPPKVDLAGIPDHVTLEDAAATVEAYYRAARRRYAEGNRRAPQTQDAKPQHNAATSSKSATGAPSL